MPDCFVMPEFAARRLAEILEDMRSGGVRPTALAVIAAATDAGASDDLAEAIATLFQKKQKEVCREFETC